MEKVIKTEFIDRYKFLYNNIDLILMPLIYEKTLGKFDLRISKRFLESLEFFLLSDIPYEQTDFYKRITELSDDISIVENCRNKRTYLNSYIGKKYIDRYDVKTILQIVRNFALAQEDSVIKDKKLLTLDEYFRFNRYNNSSVILKGGAVLGYEDLGVYCERLGDHDKPCKFKRSHLLCSNFIDYIADPNNHREDNNSIFSEDEKQVVYLELHPGVMPWNKERKRIVN